MEYDCEFAITVILLLANGDPEDSLSAITRSIDAGNRLIGTKVTILSFGMNTGVLSYMKFVSVQVSCSIVMYYR